MQRYGDVIRLDAVPRINYMSIVQLVFLVMSNGRCLLEQVLDKMLKRHSVVTIPFDNAHRLFDTDVDAALLDDDDSDTVDGEGAHADALDRSTDDDGRRNDEAGHVDCSTREEDTASGTVMFCMNRYIYIQRPRSHHTE